MTSSARPAATADRSCARRSSASRAAAASCSTSAREGRGIGLYNKLDAYALQDEGLDTYAANAALGLPEDARDYTAAAQMLAALGVTELDLLSNNPDKAGQLRALGIAVRDRVPTGVFPTAHNVHYLRTKVLQTQHTLPLTELTELTELTAG